MLFKIGKKGEGAFFEGENIKRNGVIIVYWRNDCEFQCFIHRNEIYFSLM